MWLIRFIKNWTLLCSLIVGSVVYITFSRIPLLEPIGDAVGPRLVDLMPYVIFTMLYLTFCKIDMHNFRPRKWHFALQGIRVLLTTLVVIAINLVPAADHETKIILEGVFICVICPTAAAAPVLTEKLGGGIATMTVYMIIANIFSIIIIPTFFPMVERSAHITFGFAFLLVLKRVLLVLAVPLVLALLSQRFAPRVVEWVKRRHNLAFYLWSFNLSIIMGLAVRMVSSTPLTGEALFLLLFLPLVVCIILFSIGKAVGGIWGENINGGQALGQKNNVVGIWLMNSFLNPVAVIAPCAYVVWQNIINAVQLWYKNKHGYLKW